MSAFRLVHPRPGIYLRQVDVAGVNTNLIEQHQRTLGAMLNLAMPESTLNPTGNSGDFARRCGFRSRPRIIRFRSLDPRLRLTHTDADTVGVDTEIDTELPSPRTALT